MNHHHHHHHQRGHQHCGWYLVEIKILVENHQIFSILCSVIQLIFKNVEYFLLKL
jgi:hypothetical protein